MKYINEKTVLIFSGLLLMVPVYPALAEDLGRMFFTPDERQVLDDLRAREASESVTSEIIIEIEPEPEPEIVKPDVGSITVNGLVYRKNGKSTAWVNNANSYEGDLANRYIQIDAKNIKPEDVEIAIPVSNKKLNLGVGDYYDPDTDETITPRYNSD